jgi:hypothetical protein
MNLENAMNSATYFFMAQTASSLPSSRIASLFLVDKRTASFGSHVEIWRPVLQLTNGMS